MHDTVIHQQNFMDPLQLWVHMQTIEELWKHPKKLRRQMETKWTISSNSRPYGLRMNKAPTKEIV